ncbi:hypothetical protein OAO87_00020, partial [bacterium]|nr:hypothetical protein [bacterium]
TVLGSQESAPPASNEVKKLFLNSESAKMTAAASLSKSALTRSASKALLSKDTKPLLPPAGGAQNFLQRMCAAVSPRASASASTDAEYASQQVLAAELSTPDVALYDPFVAAGATASPPDMPEGTSSLVSIKSGLPASAAPNSSPDAEAAASAAKAAELVALQDRAMKNALEALAKRDAAVDALAFAQEEVTDAEDHHREVSEKLSLDFNTGLQKGGSGEGAAGADEDDVSPSAIIRALPVAIESFFPEQSWTFKADVVDFVRTVFEQSAFDDNITGAISQFLLGVWHDVQTGAQAQTFHEVLSRVTSLLHSGDLQPSLPAISREWLRITGQVFRNAAASSRSPEIADISGPRYGAPEPAVGSGIPHDLAAVIDGMQKEQRRLFVALAEEQGQRLLAENALAMQRNQSKENSGDKFGGSHGGAGPPSDGTPSFSGRDGPPKGGSSSFGGSDGGLGGSSGGGSGDGHAARHSGHPGAGGGGFSGGGGGYPGGGTTPVSATVVPTTPGTGGLLSSCPPKPLWYNVSLAPGLSLEVRNGRDFATALWFEGPVNAYDFKTQPFSADTICRRIADIKAGEFAAYGNVRGLWFESMGTMLIWWVRGNRPVSAANSLLCTMVSTSLQLHPAFKAERPRIVRIETDTTFSSEQRVLELVHIADKVFIPRNRAQMLLTLQAFTWREGQSAFALWKAMDTARVEHNETCQTLCEQYLSNIHRVVTTETARGSSPESPTDRWLLAVQILSLVEDQLSCASPDEVLLESIRLTLERDRRDAHTPLAAIPAAPPARGRAHVNFVTDEQAATAARQQQTLDELRTGQQNQQRTLDILVAGSGSPPAAPAPATATTGGQFARGARRRNHKHEGVPGCADIVYIVGTKKIWANDFLQFEFNPSREDGRCTHKECPGCPAHEPPITVTYNYDEALKMNEGHPPTRNPKTNKGPRCLQPHECIAHPVGRCYDIWDELWRFRHEHPDDPDAEKFVTPLSQRQVQDRLAVHKRAIKLMATEKMDYKTALSKCQSSS